MVVQKEMEKLAVLDCAWDKIKLVLQEAVHILQELLIVLPAGLIRTIVVAVISGLSLLISLFPDCNHKEGDQS